MAAPGGGTSSTVEAIFWGVKWSDTTFVADKTTGLDALYSGVGSSNYASTNTEYTGSNGQVGTSVSYAGHVVDTSSAPRRAPRTSAILAEVSKGEKIAQFKPPSSVVTATVDAYTGLKPGPYTHKTIRELFLPGTVPTQKETVRVGRAIDSATGLLWQDGCAGPKVTRGFFDLSEVESNFPAWQKANAAWGARAAKGPGAFCQRRARAVRGTGCSRDA